MIIQTKKFQSAANKILTAISSGLSKDGTCLGLSARDSQLYLTVSNREFYVAVKFPLEGDEAFEAVVDANLFLSLISGITTETFTINIKDNAVVVAAGKSNYKVAMVYENDKLMEIAPIVITNPTVSMPISKDILESILNVNSKELLKIKNAASVNELQKLYYIDETGCFTFTTGACLNSFSLEKPVKMLLNDRIVKLFKLFDEDVSFNLGHDPIGAGQVVTKISMQTSEVYLSAIITCDDILISKIQGPCAATKRFIEEAYSHKLVLSASEMAEAISRLLLFTKNNKAADKVNMNHLPVRAKISGTELTFADKFDNTEAVTIENGSYTSGEYEFIINVIDLKLVLDSCKGEHITFNCGNGRSIVINRGPISNLIPQSKPESFN